MLLPIIICVIVGAVLSSPGHTPNQMHIGNILSKVATVGLFLVGLIFLYAARNYHQRYPNNQYPFKICFIVSALFTAALIYKIVYIFEPKIQTSTWAFFVFSPLLELTALVVLSGDLQKHFLGYPSDKEGIPADFV
jgi:hypothetical protein